jgi:hypothetical protein
MSNITGNDVDCYLVTHCQGYYGNMFMWLFNLHNGFLDAPLRARKTVADDTEEYRITNNKVEHFHLRPDDYHKWYLDTATWDQHIENILAQQQKLIWRPNKHFEKLIVKPGTHAPQQLIKQPNISKIKTKLILNLTVDKDNIDFLTKLENRVKILTTNNIEDGYIKSQHAASVQAVEKLKKYHTVVNIDIDKLLFKFDDDEYNKVLGYLGTEPILFWKRKLKYGMELINE